MTHFLNKPIGRKAYGSIGHLPGSRLGLGDHHVPEGQAAIACNKVRKGDRVIVQEKLDGSCCAVACLENGDIVAIGRAGWLAQTSKYEQHQLFAAWVRDQQGRFRELLQPNERVVGEWLAQAHGTRYDLKHEPFVAFDIITLEPEATDTSVRRALADEVRTRCALVGLTTPFVLHDGTSAFRVSDAVNRLGIGGFHGAIDPVEGAVWRVEREGRVDFLAKYVHAWKVDGSYLPEVSGGEPVWNWKPRGK